MANESITSLFVTASHLSINSETRLPTAIHPVIGNKVIVTDNRMDYNPAADGSSGEFESIFSRRTETNGFP
jgi:hypothetical protein